MSDLLDAMRQDFENRMTAHEGMLALLGLHLTEHDAPLVFTELKATFAACGACRCPKTCVEWQSTHIDRPPPWCHRRSAFLALAETCGALGPQRPDAHRPV